MAEAPQTWRVGDVIAEAETWVSLGLHPNVCSCHYVRTLGGIPRAVRGSAAEEHHPYTDSDGQGGGRHAVVP
jgi:hypothetical protein